MVLDQSVIAAGQGEGEDHVQAARSDGSFTLRTSVRKPDHGHMDKLSGKNVKSTMVRSEKGDLGLD
jgi:hypothetical protein